MYGDGRRYQGKTAVQNPQHLTDLIKETQMLRKKRTRTFFSNTNGVTCRHELEIDSASNVIDHSNGKLLKTDDVQRLVDNDGVWTVDI